MPLRSGSDKGTVSANIRELIRSGRKPDQAIAIAMSNARRHAAAFFCPTAHKASRVG